MPICGYDAVFGLPEEALRRRNCAVLDADPERPPGRLHFRFRAADIARVFIRNGNETRHFVLYYIPGATKDQKGPFGLLEQGINRRA